MPVTIHFLILMVLLAALLGSLTRMSDALNEAAFGDFLIWTCIASIIAGLPMTL